MHAALPLPPKTEGSIRPRGGDASLSPLRSGRREGGSPLRRDLERRGGKGRGRGRGRVCHRKEEEPRRGGFEKAKGISQPQPGEGWQWQSRRAAAMDPGCGSDGWASRDGRG